MRPRAVSRIAYGRSYPFFPLFPDLSSMRVVPPLYNHRKSNVRLKVGVKVGVSVGFDGGIDYARARDDGCKDVLKAG